ncbi:JmjC domain-containing histone demethylation protein 3D [Melanomma pulvis-pyrius CBS 109.77]|uniref:[histone H3]-trimethyl-L-lysine(9) demethylase n=1 Tax=Melanomma pulvis-pyrius CBS 109.77 TaxID=1314802 RepID=A0A6A6X4U9_9PLEO|nr:JmjC domain-containing histone demethylation protein 3D [Melanomma pulvis-pyrius CBS 109.77]
MEAPVDVVPSVEATLERNDDPASKPALTPPTSEDMDKRDERMSSELSELDSDDDGEEIEPDHYFDGGKIPVFKPTMDQFRSFKKYINKIDKYGMKSGIVKVIPPKEWRNSLPDLSDAVKAIKVKNPIMQEFAGQHGIYTQANIEKQRTYNLPEWRALTDEAHHQPPAKRGERRKAPAEAPSRTRSTRAQASTPNADDSTPSARRGPGRPRKRPARTEPKDEDDDNEGSIDVPPTPKSPGREEKSTSTKNIKKEEKDDSTPTKARGRQPRSNQPKSTASRRMNNRAAVADFVDEKAFKNFDYRVENLEEYTVERCKELEENYWRTINYGQPMYGADMPGSLFDDRTTSWNVAKLENLLDVLGTKVPGVNTAYLYLGMWKATFAWHLEDVDLYSINYIHFGAPKQWYSISQEDARRFEAAMKYIWPRDAKNCSQFLRHKTYLISPQQLEKQFNIKVNRLVHYEGEFVITYPYGYHSGYNIGYNCAESVNFANESWLSYGRIAKKCECESDSVWVDVNEIERKLRGEPTPEYYEETDDEDEDEAPDHLPSPPPSVAGKTKKKPGRKPATNKRKRGKEEPVEVPKPKKVRRIRIRLKIPGRGMPCILCPNDVEFDDLLPTDNGLKAHRICADYTPETFISSRPTETVCNVANIGKDRLELKCNYCRSKRGAVFQCSQKKCTRAFHATCAAAAGVQVDLGPMPTFDEEGIEYYYDGYDFRCRFHRPKKRNAKTVDSDTLEKDKFIFNFAKKLKPKDIVQFQYVGGEMYQIYGGLVIENRPGESTVLVEVLPDGDRTEVEWKYLLALDPADSQRPKPSANAKPLPEHLKENDASLNITNRTDGVPEIGDPFYDPNAPQKWAEFHTAPEVTQKVAKVDFNKDLQLWFYLGKAATEARPQYTEDLAIPRHNVKSSFLDTVKPPPRPMPPIERRSYPASYPIQPSPLSNPPRTPIQPQYRPASGSTTATAPKAYQYKPKDLAIYKQPGHNYSPETWKNPNSPVAHQPNVVYDYRATAPQYGYPSYTNGYHQHRPPQQPVQQYHGYAPPQSYSSSGWKPPTTTAPILPGIEQYTQPPQAGHALPPYPYYSSDGASAPRHLPPFPYSHPQGPAPGPAHGPVHGSAQGPSQRPAYGSSAHQTPVSQTQSSSRSAAPNTSMLSDTGLPKNPSIPNGGFTPEWIPKVGSTITTPNLTAPRPPPSSTRPPHSTPGPGLIYDGRQSPTLARPMPQFQSQDAFQRELSKAPMPPATGMQNWERMIKQLGSTTGSPSLPSLTTAAAPTNGPQFPLSRPSNSSYEMSTGTTPLVRSHTPPHVPPSEPQRPIPSPLSDVPGSPKRPEYSPISDDGKELGSRPMLPPLPSLPNGEKFPTGETWRYT